MLRRPFFSTANQRDTEGFEVEGNTSKDGLRHESRLAIRLTQMTLFAHPQIVTSFNPQRKKNSTEN
jgi:hypothetical protein